MTYPHGLLVACPSCSSWPMAARLKSMTVGAEESCVGFKCVKCGHKERGVPTKASAAMRAPRSIKAKAVHILPKSTAAV
jgi:Zn ribbon nucleic-acid-binding protein